MACFIVPMTEAVVTAVVKKAVQNKEKKNSQNPDFSVKLGHLSGMLWGGSGMLAFEHLWHGEVVPFPPFLTAMSDPQATSEMLHEMATSGTAMAVLVTVAWAGMELVKKKQTAKSTEVSS